MVFIGDNCLGLKRGGIIEPTAMTWVFLAVNPGPAFEYTQ